MRGVAEGASLTKLGSDIGVSRSTLHDWLHAEPGRSARARSSRQRSAEAFEEQAEQEIRKAADPFELAKAKELAHHYRWAARVRSPGTHGEKLETTLQGPNGGPVEFTQIERVIVDGSSKT